MEPASTAPTVDALRERVRDLDGENQRLALRMKDLQQQLWGRELPQRADTLA